MTSGGLQNLAEQEWFTVAEAAEYLRVRRVLDGTEELPAFDAEDDALKWIRAGG